MSTYENPQYLLIGEVLRPHGVRGDLRVRLWTEHPDRLRTLKSLYLGRDVHDQKAQRFQVDGVRLNVPYALIKLKGIDDRDAADRFRELHVMVDIKEAVPLEEGEFYVYQLFGMTVQLEDGAVLGTLSDVLETGANDVYVVNSPIHGEVLLPVIDEVILKTDIEARLLTVRLLDGLLPEPKAKRQDED